MRKFILIILACSLGNVMWAQSNLWSPLLSNEVVVSKNAYQLETNSELMFQFNIEEFKSRVKEEGDNFILSLPIANDELVDFKLTLNTTMSAGLMDKFPAIRTFDGWAQDGSHRKAKIDIGPNYFRAMIMQSGAEDLFIDPLFFNHLPTTQYVLYSRSELIKDDSFICHEETEKELVPVDFTPEKGIQSCELRTYRVGVSATGEYTVFHGGTLEDALAAQVTTMNRVNGIYERDLSVTMTIIPNNDLLIFLDAQTDPFTNGDPGAMIMENIDVLNDSIGDDNYDIGHVFGTNSGGLAGLNVVCYTDYKAMGVTGSGAPIGDSFDIDYVAHEMGHQFGGNHTFNSSCSGNRNGSTAMEPGSGSTIMAYAGVCSPNVQSHSDAFFHAISLKEIGSALNNSEHTCPVITPLINIEPVVETEGNFIIPAGTPFTLRANGSDDDGDDLTYAFDQMNKQVSPQPPEASSTKGPNFRSIEPSVENYRRIPSIANQKGNNFKWERLSDVARSYKFRVTVRDNAENGGCTDYADLTVTVDAASGPFLVTYPNDIGIEWIGLTQRTITWDVANTDEAPVSCENVKILLSTDWGDSFTTLVESTPNTGSLEIEVPNIETNKALIMVESEDGRFFDISDKRFKIIKSTASVKNEVKQNIVLYPNPGHDIITLKFDANEFLDGYQVYNVAGQIVLSSTEKVQPNTTVDISTLDAGVYFFETTMNKERGIFKLIKN